MRTLRPGLLVSLKTTIKGGVEYDRNELDAAHVLPDGALVSKWETAKRIEDPAEYEAAVKVRGACRTAITRVCASSDFGLLCPSDRELDLAAAIKEARALADAHNRAAVRTSIEVYTIVGRIAADDAEAMRAINSEIRGLLTTMEEGIKGADAKAIRAAANAARNLGSMLTPDAALKVESAIEAARTAARAIVKRIEKDGESAVEVIASLKMEDLQAARFAFLDMDAPIAVEAAPLTPASLDLF